MYTGAPRLHFATVIKTVFGYLTTGYFVQWGIVSYRRPCGRILFRGGPGFMLLANVPGGENKNRFVQLADRAN